MTPGTDAGWGAGGGLLGDALARGAGQEVTEQVLRATQGRWGGLAAGNLWHPGAIASKWYGSTVIGAMVGFDLEVGGRAAVGLYGYLACRTATGPSGGGGGW